MCNLWSKPLNWNKNITNAGNFSIWKLSATAFANDQSPVEHSIEVKIPQTYTKKSRLWSEYCQVIAQLAISHFEIAAKDWSCWSPHNVFANLRQINNELSKTPPDLNTFHTLIFSSQIYHIATLAKKLAEKWLLLDETKWRKISHQTVKSRQKIFAIGNKNRDKIEDGWNEHLHNFDYCLPSETWSVLTLLIVCVRQALPFISRQWSAVIASDMAVPASFMWSGKVWVNQRKWNL
jgi:hypothetical protein